MATPEDPSSEAVRESIRSIAVRNAYVNQNKENYEGKLVELVKHVQKHRVFEPDEINDDIDQILEQIKYSDNTVLWYISSFSAKTGKTFEACLQRIQEADGSSDGSDWIQYCFYAAQQLVDTRDKVRRKVAEQMLQLQRSAVPEQYAYLWEEAAAVMAANQQTPARNRRSRSAVEPDDADADDDDGNEDADDDDRSELSGDDKVRLCLVSIVGL